MGMAPAEVRAPLLKAESAGERSGRPKRTLMLEEEEEEEELDQQACQPAHVWGRHTGNPFIRFGGQMCCLAAARRLHRRRTALLTAVVHTEARSFVFRTHCF